MSTDDLKQYQLQCQYAAIEQFVNQPSLVKSTVETSPDSHYLTGSDRLRPINVVTEQILIKEELFRYRPSPEDEQALEDCWKSAEILVRAQCPVAHEQTLTQPFLHILMQSDEIPAALVNLALRRFENQLEYPDSEGNLPLHYVAARLVSEEDMDPLEELLEAHPRGACVRNHKNQLPFDLAARAGRSLDLGILSLLKFDTGVIQEIDLPKSALPKVIDLLSRHRQTELVYHLIRANLILMQD